ncbi:Nucleoside-diphosphate-sugar epimerase [Singulisphaera sp. GP187]|uniref:SDR family oxidoreductase n=1 Tax=Singulisphaera sp. GP187 TaxID=1882752 RepID=UPI0009274E21|nr:SDR family oxidoreductase [Singulisphaera sp. GP187]SIN82105.1 Nucleoside-diphosphate-sugar epimerase [Singulisphaera sp. GP187]
MSRTLIVGCGYLGQRVGKILAARGETVYGTVRSTARAASLLSADIEPVIANVLAPDSLADLPVVDRVLYCVGFDRSGADSMRSVYVEGLRNFLEHAPGTAGQLVYVSSTGVYGRNDGGWITEDDPAEPAHESGRVCLEAEAVARHLGPGRGLNPVVIRCSGLYGPQRLPRKATLERNEPIAGDPTKFLNLIHIDDAANLAVATLDRGAPGRIYHVSDDRPVERQEFYRLVATLLGLAPPRFEALIPDNPAAAREESNKRISNRRIRTELQVELTFPDIQSGVPAAIAASG